MNKDQYWRSELQRIGDALDLDEPTRELARAFYLTCEITELTRGWSVDEVLAASIYLAVREVYVPVSLQEIADETSLEKYEVAQTFRFIVDQLNIALEPEEPEKFVDEYVDRLNEEFDSNLGDTTKQAAKNLISIENGLGELPGHSPRCIAASAVYVAAESENKRVTQAEIAEVSGAAPSTIRRLQKTHCDIAERFDWL